MSISTADGRDHLANFASAVDIEVVKGGFTCHDYKVLLLCFSVSLLSM